MGEVAIQTTTSPVLDTGAFAATFNDYEKVVQAAVFLEGPQIDDYMFEATHSVATNVVTITIMKMQASAGSPTWAVAETANVDAKRVVVIADVV